MEVWFYQNRNHGREAIRRDEEFEKVYTRAPPERVRRSFALLTRTYQGSLLPGHVKFQY
jgi:hypothetical protein